MDWKGIEMHAPLGSNLLEQSLQPAAEALFSYERPAEPLQACESSGEFVALHHEKPLTDSGYGSVPHRNYSMDLAPFPAPPACQNIQDRTLADRFDGKGAKTTYSAATTVAPHIAQEYVSEFSNDLHWRIKDCVDADNWPSVFQRLPELIKAFAIELGHDFWSPLTQDIMYFLHKRHRSVFPFAG